MFFSSSRSHGFSLVEVVIAIGLFMLLIPNIISLILSNHTASHREKTKIEATSLAEQASEAIKSIKDYDWDDLNEGDYVLDKSNGYWELTPGTSEVLNDQFTRTIQIVETKTYAKSIQVQVSWTNLTGQTNIITSKTQLTNWKRFIWAQSTAREFGYGRENSVKISSLEDGEVQMIDKGGLPELATFDHLDFDDLETIRDTYIDINDNVLYMVTNQSAGAEFLVFDISNVGNKDIILKKSFEVGYDTVDLAVSDGYAFLAVNNSAGEVQIVDLSDMTLESTIDIDGIAPALSIAITGSNLYVGTAIENDGYWADPPTNSMWVDYGELWRYDVSNPGNPSVSNEREFDGDINDIAIYNDSTVIIATDKNTREVYTRSLSLGGQDWLNLPGNADATTLHIQGDHVLVGRKGSSDPEVYNVDLSNVSNLTYDNDESLSLTGNPDVTDIFAGDDWIYVSLANDTAEIFTVGSDLSDPEKLGAQLYIDLGDFTIQSLTHLGAYVYIGTDETDPFRVLTGPIDTWSDLDILATINLSGSDDPNDIFVGDEYIYVTRDHYFYVLNRYEFSSGGTDFLEGSHYSSATINGFTIDANEEFAYLATTDNSKEFVILDITDPTDPDEIQSYNVPGNSDGTHIDFNNETVYLVTKTDPVHWFWAWFWSWFWNWTCTQDCLAESCSRWFWFWCIEWECTEWEQEVCDRQSLGSSSLYLFDVSDPETSTSVIGSMYLDKIAIQDITIGGENLYVGTIGAENDENIMIIRVANPTNLEIANQQEIPGAGIFSIFYRDQKIYTSAGDEGSDTEGEESNADFTIWDSFDPTDLYEIGKLNVGTFDTVFIQGDFAYLSSVEEDRELMILDISNLSNPQLLGTFSYNGFNVEGIFIKDDYIYFITDDDSGEILVIGQSEEDIPPQSHWGLFTSSALNSDWNNTNYEKIFWNQDGDGAIECQIRTANTEANLDTALWVGNDGTNATHYVSGDTVVEDPSATGKQWIQYRCFFLGDGTQTPILKDMSIEYDKN